MSVYDAVKTEGQAAMRGRINVYGIEKAAEDIGDQYGAPATTEAAFIHGIILAAFEAGQLHQHTITTSRQRPRKYDADTSDYRAKVLAECDGTDCPNPAAHDHGGI